MSLRAKFKVSAILNYGNNATLEMAPVMPVFDPETKTYPNNENKIFWDATPQGKLSMSVQAQEGMSEILKMKVGDEYYIDITKPRSK